MGQVFNKRRGSRLSSDRLMVVARSDVSVDVRTYNFHKKKWESKLRTIKLEHFLKNYEAETDG